MLTKSSPYVWLALLALFVVSAATSFFITLGVIPDASAKSAPKPIEMSSQPTEVASSAQKPTKAPPRAEKILYAPDSVVEFLEIGAAESWGFNKPSNSGGLITMAVDSKNKLETKILLDNCKYLVDAAPIPCPRGGPDPVLGAGSWSSAVPFIVDMSLTKNRSPKVLIISFDTVNAEGTFPVKLRFTFGKWR